MSTTPGDALQLSRQFLIRPADFVRSDFAIDPQLAATHQFLLDIDPLLLGPAPAAKLLPFVARCGIRSETDLNPVAFGRFD